MIGELRQSFVCLIQAMNFEHQVFNVRWKLDLLAIILQADTISQALPDAGRACSAHRNQLTCAPEKLQFPRDHQQQDAHNKDRHLEQGLEALLRLPSLLIYIPGSNQPKPPQKRENPIRNRRIISAHPYNTPDSASHPKRSVGFQWTSLALQNALALPIKKSKNGISVLGRWTSHEEKGYVIQSTAAKIPGRVPKTWQASEKTSTLVTLLASRLNPTTAEASRAGLSASLNRPARINEYPGG